MADSELLAQLRCIDTPTICNALERVAPGWRGEGFTRRPLLCTDPELPPIVGFARTARIRAATESGRSAAAALNADLDYYRYVASGAGPTVTVIEDLDEPAGVGAWWGEVHTHVHRGLGSLGVVTNGSVRDLDDIADGFQVLAGSVSPSHAFVHVVDFGSPVRVAGMTVDHGDLVHADRHGAVVIPRSAAAALPPAAAAIAAEERIVIEASRAPNFDAERLESILRDRSDGVHG